jgi:hypothetical protein
MSSLHRKLEEYLTVRRAMGFKMERHEKLLGQYPGGTRCGCPWSAGSPPG